MDGNGFGWIFSRLGIFSGKRNIFSCGRFRLHYCVIPFSVSFHVIILLHFYLSFPACAIDSHSLFVSLMFPQCLAEIIKVVLYFKGFHVLIATQKLLLLELVAFFASTCMYGHSFAPCAILHNAVGTNCSVQHNGFAGLPMSGLDKLHDNPFNTSIFHWKQLNNLKFSGIYPYHDKDNGAQGDYLCGI